MGVTGVSAGICAEAEIQSTNSLPEVSFEVRIMGEAVDETRFWFDLDVSLLSSMSQDKKKERFQIGSAVSSVSSFLPQSGMWNRL